jgi:2,3-bisphosphoglycerate-independent phosphoglycerate mutase
MIIYQGVADHPLKEFDNRTPLQVARCPEATRLAAAGQQGLVKLPSDIPGGQSSAALAVMMGVKTEAARKVMRGPVEAASLETPLPEEYTMAYRGNFITCDTKTVHDGVVERLSLEETQSLAEQLDTEWSGHDICFRASAPARLVVGCQAKNGMPEGRVPLFGPGDALGAFVPAGRKGEVIRAVLERSHDILADSPLNEVRIDLGENPASGVWLWGGGRCDRAREIFKAVPPDGAILTQSILARGAARLGGWDCVRLLDPWNLPTGKPAFCTAEVVEAVRNHDFLLVYLESPRKLGQYGTGREKVRALEALDQHVLAPLLSILAAEGSYRILLGTDGAVSTGSGEALPDAVPYILAGHNMFADGTKNWNEEQCRQGRLGEVSLARLVKMFRKDN